MVTQEDDFLRLGEMLRWLILVYNLLLPEEMARIYAFQKITKGSRNGLTPLFWIVPVALVHPVSRAAIRIGKPGDPR